jgi:hypothetical protein
LQITAEPHGTTVMLLVHHDGEVVELDRWSTESIRMARPLSSADSATFGDDFSAPPDG